MIWRDGSWRAVWGRHIRNKPPIYSHGLGHDRPILGIMRAGRYLGTERAGVRFKHSVGGTIRPTIVTTRRNPMNKLSALALTAALALSAPLAAHAQDAGVGVDAGVDAGVGVDTGTDSGVDAGVDTGVDAGVDAGTDDAGADLGVDAGADAGMSADTPDAATLMTALEGTADFDISTIDASTTINIVAISEIETDETWTDAWAEHEADVTAKHGEIEANADLTAALEAEGYTAEDVVAIHGEATGEVWVFVDA